MSPSAWEGDFYAGFRGSRLHGCVLIECTLRCAGYSKIGQMIEENPDLPLPFLQNTLLGREQVKAGQGTPYVFGEEDE